MSRIYTCDSGGKNSVFFRKMAFWLMLMWSGGCGDRGIPYSSRYVHIFRKIIYDKAVKKILYSVGADRVRLPQDTRQRTCIFYCYYSERERAAKR